MDMLKDHRSAMVAKHAGLAMLAAMAVATIGVLMGYGALDLYETANHWVLQA